MHLTDLNDILKYIVFQMFGWYFYLVGGFKMFSLSFSVWIYWWKQLVEFWALYSSFFSTKYMADKICRWMQYFIESMRIKMKIKHWIKWQISIWKPKQETTKWIICCTVVELPAMTNGSWDWRVRKTIQIQLITVNLLWQFVACEQSTSSFWVSTAYKNAHFLCHKFSWTIYSSASQI